MKYTQRSSPSKWFIQCFLIMCLLSAIIVTANFSVAPLFADQPQASDLAIYTDALPANWADWSWDTTPDFASTTAVHTGAHAIAVTYKAADGGLSLHAPTPINSSDYSAVEFWAYGGSGGTALNFATQATDDAGLSTLVKITAPAGVWTRFNVPLSALGNPPAIARFNWQGATNTIQPTFYLDDIRLVASAGANSALPDPTADATVNNLDRPAGIAIAPNGRVFVAIFGSDNPFRQGAVQSWASTAALRGGAAPDIVLGKAGATQVGNPEAVAVDAQNRLYIADTGNHRVLVYNSVTKTGQQPDFIFGSQGTSTKLENKFQFTRGLAIDSANHLFVTDEFNDRILAYNLPIASNSPTPFAQFTGLKGPRAVAVDSSNNVYIADSQNAQVKIFNQPVTANNYTTPDRTIGQQHASECNSTANQTSATFLSCPIDLVLDRAGNLFISDTPNHRVLGYKPGSDTPTAVYGQADFTGSQANRGGAAGNNTLNSPLGMAFDTQGNFYLADFDNSRVLAFDAPVATPTPTPTDPSGPTDVTLTIDVNADRKPISPDIYGMNWADEALAKELSIPVRRWGGNATSRYNWKNDIGNHAIDWYFENIKESDAANLPDDSLVNRFIAQDHRTGTQTFLTVPMSGWVSNDDANACGYSTAKYNYTPAVNPDGVASVAPDRPTCGNGVTQFKNGHSWEPVFYQGNDPKDTSIAITGAFAGEWTTYLKNHFGAADAGGVRFYGLDNEPELWNTSHADVHPAGLSYDELGKSTIEYAAAIKASDPSAQVLGPEFGGWWGFFDSTKDTAASTDADRQAHGNQPIIEWYLDQLAAYEKKNGVRLLDYLDLHFYPQDDGVFLDPQSVDTAGQAKRLDSIRALWDPTYQETSWIKDTADGPIVRLIPRMHEWVNQHYPGTKIGLSEYGWGALDHINGALAQADILGVLGREAVDLAALWGPPATNQPGAYAFRMYRNYDGNGSKFGDTSIHAASSDQGKLAVYAAQRSGDLALTVMIINKTSGVLTSKVNLANFAPASAQVYRYSAANLNTIEHLADQAVDANGFTAPFPANSITLMVVPLTGDVPNPTPVGGTPAGKVFLPMVKR